MKIHASQTAAAKTIHAMRRRRRATAAAAIAMAAIAGAQPARAATLYWDPSLSNATTGGGPGTWDAATLNWFDANPGDPDVAWPNSGSHAAIFSGTPGTGLVSITAAIPGQHAHDQPQRLHHRQHQRRQPVLQRLHADDKRRRLGHHHVAH